MTSAIFRLILVAAFIAPLFAEADDGVHLSVTGSDVCEPGLPLAVHLAVDNAGAAAAEVQVDWTLQANPTFVDTPSPDPVLGRDLARGATSSVTVDGKDRGDALLTDGDDYSAFEIPWDKVRDAVATIDLGSITDIATVRWRASDANKIWEADVATSADGRDFHDVDSAQGVEMHGKWGLNALPWSQTSARWLRFHFHKGTDEINGLSLPATIEVFSAQPAAVAIPTVGPRIAGGSATAAVAAGDHADIVLNGEAPLGPGGYLLGLKRIVGGRTVSSWQPLFVRPGDTVDPVRAARFGVNVAEMSLAPEMRRCGFSWVRFENCKWAMFSPAPDTYAFDGSVAPWHVDDDTVFGTYAKLGMQVLPYVFQTPEWATTAPAGTDRNRAGYPPKNPADYGEAIYQLVARYGHAAAAADSLKTNDHKSGLGLIDVVELWNEPNLNDPGWGPFVGPIADYFTVMRAGVDGAHRADAKILVSAAGWGGFDLATVGMLSEFHYPDGKTPLDLVDIVNVHFYSGREEPELCGHDPNAVRSGAAQAGQTYPEQIANLVTWRDRNKPTARIWLTETGNDVGGPIGRTERYQAGKVPRAVMLALAGGIDKVFIYREKGSDPSMHAGAGLLRNDLSLRPLWFTVAAMIRQLQGFSGKALRLPSKDPRVWMLLWQDGQRRLVTAWTTSGTAACPTDLGPATVVDAFGRVEASATAPATSAEKATLVLSEMPTYITPVGDSPGLAKLVAAGKAAAGAEARRFAQLSAITMALFDFGSTDHVGTLAGYGLPRRFTAVVKDTVWDDKIGYGFTKPALSDEDQRWIDDPLERDGCKVGNDDAFRFRLPPGSTVCACPRRRSAAGRSRWR